MNEPVPLVRKLQAEAIDKAASVTSLLRLAKLIAHKLGLSDALVWIDRELDGYPGVAAKDLPEYRQLHGEPKAYNPYHGWQPIQFGDSDTAKTCSFAPIGQALGAIEEGLKDKSGGTYIFPYSTEMKRKLVESTGSDVHIELSFGQIWNIVDQVRNLILNWSIELEKAGILGEGMSFTSKEKTEAQPVSQHFFIQNAGVVGQISDHATVTNNQNATAALELSLPQVSDFVGQGYEALALLPEDIRIQLQPILREIEGEVGREAPRHDRIREWLRSAKTVAEGAAGNLVASGIASVISSILGN